MINNKYKYGHELCFFIHDVMVDFIENGYKNNIFISEIGLSDTDKQNLLGFDGDILSWLKNNNKKDDYEMVIKKTIIPALLSDMMHCIYEALKAMEKRKPSIAYMLIRKPIQENLYLFEEIILLKSDFINIFESNSLKLRHKNGGDVNGHISRIERVLSIINFDQVLDASYIATLRYDKNHEDSFDGICNQAMHLFTEHKAIKTENLNINLIFGTNESIETLYKFMYSRLPYLMYYIYIVFEQLADNISKTSREYLCDIQCRLSALFLLAYSEIDSNYQAEQFYTLCLIFESQLTKKFQCYLTLDQLKCISRSGNIL